MSTIPADLAPPVLPRRRQLLLGTAFASVAVSVFIFGLLGRYLELKAVAERAVRAAGGDAEAIGAAWLGENSVPLTQPVMQLFTLLMGAVTIQWAAWAIARNVRGQAYLGFGITALLGLAFLNQTTFLWNRVGLGMNQPEGPVFYAVTGGHFALMIAAVIFVLLVAFRCLGGQYSATLPDGPAAAAMFWHVTTALYSVIWLAVYVMK